MTGGAGFIGSNLVGLLLDEGHEVTVLDDLSSGYVENLVPEATFVKADVSDAEAVRAAIVDARGPGSGANYRAGVSATARGAFNLGSATRVTINDLVAMMAELAGEEPVALARWRA